MQAYALQDLTLVLEHDSPKPPDGLERLLEDLSFVRGPGLSAEPVLRLSVSSTSVIKTSKNSVRETFCVDGFRGVEYDDHFLVTDGDSQLRIQPANGIAEARVQPAFFAKSEVLQRNFWAFGLMKLLRAQGVFTLHAAALVSPIDDGLLLVASPGSGKSTLTIGLIRREWRYLSDDAVLLRREGNRVAALALRKSFYVDADVHRQYADLYPGPPVADAAGGQRHRVDIDRAFPGSHTPTCYPRILVFPSIDRKRESKLEPLSAASATKVLLGESGPQLFDLTTMKDHLELLRKLVAQCRVYHLRAGPDLHANPGSLEQLLDSARE